MEMQEVSPPKVSPQNPKPKKKKLLNQVASTIQKKGEVLKGKAIHHLPPKPKKLSKKNTVATSPFQQMNVPPIESSIDSCDYQELRRSYLLLEKERMSLDREVSKAEGEVKILESQKFGLLDQLVVLEDLIDPSEVKNRGLAVRKQFL